MRAILLLGATGTGKTPLGEYLEEKGLNGSICSHFDFGDNLRKAAAGGFGAELLSDGDVQYVCKVIQSGALLDDDTFYIAENILRSFIGNKALGKDDILILNGLPRHVGQAEAVDAIVDVEMVIHLDCLPEVVMGRISENSGGDRTGRIDDSLPEIHNKIAIFNKRTIPLLDHYRDKNVRVVAVSIGLGTTPADVVCEISKRV